MRCMGRAEKAQTLPSDECPLHSVRRNNETQQSYVGHKTYQGVYLRIGAHVGGLRRPLPRDTRPLVPALGYRQGRAVGRPHVAQAGHGHGLRSVEAHRRRADRRQDGPRFRHARHVAERTAACRAERTLFEDRAGRLPAHMRKHARRLRRTAARSTARHRRAPLPATARDGHVVRRVVCRRQFLTTPAGAAEHRI